VTRRGNFLDDNIKLFKVNPAPNKYNTTINWVNPKDKERKLPPAPKTKNSYID